LATGVDAGVGAGAFFEAAAGAALATGFLAAGFSAFVVFVVFADFAGGDAFLAVAFFGAGVFFFVGLMRLLVSVVMP
jgi:hypothetical protein